MKPYKEPKSLNSVAKFHRIALHPIESKPIIPNRERAELRINLLREELDELQKAVFDQNIELIADALCDIQYVLSGAILEFGFADCFKELFDEVQRSNMTKVCKTEKEAQETIAKLDAKEKYVYKKVNSKFPVYRRLDNKVMKSHKYSPAQLLKIIEKNQNSL